MSADPNWTKWIKASCAKYFNDTLNSSLPMFVEGDDRPNVGSRTRCELRLDGPIITQQNPTYWILETVIDILVVTIRNNTDIYEHDANVGLVVSAFKDGITVYKYGDDPFAEVGCLWLAPQNGKDIIVSNFGQIANDTKVMQSTVEGHYLLQLKV